MGRAHGSIGSSSLSSPAHQFIYSRYGTVLYYGTYGTVPYITVKNIAVKYRTAGTGIAQYSTVGKVPYRTAQHCTKQDSKVQHNTGINVKAKSSTAQHRKAQHRTKQRSKAQLS